jgi:Membrane protein involved in the export of O-antigen and teichoic acid
MREGGGAWASDVAPKDLTRKTARGALVSAGAQGAMFVLRTGSLMVLARLLLKEDFGLVNMVTAFTGFLGLLRDAGLGMAAVQRVSITRAQASTLFWVNVTVGGLLALVVMAAAPFLTAFYGEPRLFWVTVALATTFVFNGAGNQHRAMLQRRMRFVVLAVIDITSIVFSIAVGLGMAAAGYGYWALVAMAISPTAIILLGVWLATGWIPGMPQQRAGIRSMLEYGGLVTLNNLLAYLAYNADKVLIGRFCGAGALGIYGRAYQLISLPTESLNSTIGLVAFPALSRVQNDPARFSAFFLKGYSLFLSLVMPITIGGALFADDIILILLGPKWHEAAGIFRLLAPTILVLALVNPFTWFMLAAGRAGRCLRISGVVSPILILSYVLGLKHGPQGVALGFSITMVLSLVPVMLWAKHGTMITMRDILKAVAPSFTSIAIGTAATLAVQSIVDRVEPPFARLVAESTILFGVYFFALFFIMKQRLVYVRLLREAGFVWPMGRWRTDTERV